MFGLLPDSHWEKRGTAPSSLGAQTPEGNGFCVIQAHLEPKSAPCCPLPAGDSCSCSSAQMLAVLRVPACLSPGGLTSPVGSGVTIDNAFLPPPLRMVLFHPQAGKPKRVLPISQQRQAQKGPRLV